MDTITAKLRSDKRKNPDMKEYRLLTTEECGSLSGHALFLDWFGDVCNVKITSVKTWKTRPDIEVRCQFGLYEYFKVTITPNEPNDRLVTAL